MESSSQEFGKIGNGILTGGKKVAQVAIVIVDCFLIGFNFRILKSLMIMNQNVAKEDIWFEYVVSQRKKFCMMNLVVTFNI